MEARYVLRASRFDAAKQARTRSACELSVLHADPILPRVVVMAVWTHYPEMMRWQLASLRIFLKTSRLMYLAVLNNSQEDLSNERLADMARSLGVNYTVATKTLGGPSDLHAHALNHGLAYLRNATDFGVKDVLFLLDSDMFLTTPMNLIEELNGSHIWSVVQTRNSIAYLWPNFTVLYFGDDDLPNENWSSLLDELDFRHCQGYRGTVFDSGGCTARLLDDHPELGVRRATTACTSTGGAHDAVSSACRFLSAQNSQLPANDTRCVKAHTIERAELNAACRVDPTAPDCFDHGKVYHLGSAGSNWRGCSEDWLLARRTDFRAFLGGVISEEFLGTTHP